MSSKVTLTDVALSNWRLRFLIKLPSGPPAPSIPCARRDIQNQTPMISTHGSSVNST